MWSPTLQWARRRMSQQQGSEAEATGPDVVNPFARTSPSLPDAPASPAVPAGSTRSEVEGFDSRDQQGRTRAYSAASELSSTGDSILSYQWPQTNAHGLDEGSSVISSPATGATRNIPETRLHPSATDHGFLCEVVGVGCLASDRVFWPVTWQQLVKLLLEPETAASLPVGHVVHDLCDAVRMRMQADPVAFRHQLGVDPVSSGQDLQQPQSVTAPARNAVISSIQDLHPYRNSQHAISDLSVASFPRYEPPPLHEDTRSLNSFRMYDEKLTGYGAHRQRYKTFETSEVQRAFALSVSTRDQGVSDGPAHLDDMTPRTNSFHRQIYSSGNMAQATCDPSTVYPTEHFGPSTDATGGRHVTAESNVMFDHSYDGRAQSYHPAPSERGQDDPSLDDLEMPPLPPIPNRDDFVNYGRHAVKRLNPSMEHYYWDEDHQHLYPAGPGGTFHGRGELLTFPAQSYYQVFKDKNAPPLVPSDPLPRANEWIRSQVCVRECVAFRMEGKRPATIRQHFATCKHRDSLGSDPLGRLCVLQIKASRQVKQEARARSRVGDSEEDSRRSNSRAGSVRSYASAFDEDDDDEFVSGGQRSRRKGRKSDSSRQRSTSGVSSTVPFEPALAETAYQEKTSTEGEMSVDFPVGPWSNSTISRPWPGQMHTSSDAGPLATIRAHQRQSQQRTSFQVLAENAEPASFLSMEE
ncbi:hypothetical protein OIV83_005434 [Microbotryomycetes sp. JL201]|nr:hypothetical protein OIV83_005434 [Microbotryomycetes sp. JL201]